MKLDIALRTPAGIGSPGLIRMITGAGVAGVLPTEFPETGVSIRCCGWMTAVSRTELVLEEARAMPLQIDTDRDPYLAGLVNKGRVEGKADALLRVAERRFGPLPVVARERIAAAEPEVVERWLDRVIDVPSLEALFTEPSAN